MKTLIVALDGFDIRYCPREYVNKITQKEFGVYDVSILERTFTPICFSSLITGKDPREFGYTQDLIVKRYASGYSHIMKLLYWIRRNLFGWVKSFGLRQKMVKTGQFDITKIDRNMTDEMKRHTIFNFLHEKGFDIYAPSVPSYSEDLAFRKRGHVAKLIGTPTLARKKFVDDAFKDIILPDWLDCVDHLKDNDLIFYYSKLPDEAHHTLSHISEFNDIIHNTYKKVCSLPTLYELNKIAILILSDHGFTHEFTPEGKEVYGNHSNLGFWSINVDINNKPRTVFDFHDLILELVTRET